MTSCSEVANNDLADFVDTGIVFQSTFLYTTTEYFGRCLSLATVILTTT